MRLLSLERRGVRPIDLSSPPCVPSTTTARPQHPEPGCLYGPLACSAWPAPRLMAGCSPGRRSTSRRSHTWRELWCDEAARCLPHRSGPPRCRRCWGARGKFDEIFSVTSGHPYPTIFCASEMAVYPRGVRRFGWSSALSPAGRGGRLPQRQSRSRPRSAWTAVTGLRTAPPEMLRALQERWLSGEAVPGQRTSRAQDELYLCGLKVASWRAGRLIVRRPGLYTTVFGLAAGRGAARAWRRQRISSTRAWTAPVAAAKQRGFLPAGPMATT